MPCPPTTYMKSGVPNPKVYKSFPLAVVGYNDVVLLDQSYLIRFLIGECMWGLSIFQAPPTHTSSLVLLPLEGS